MSRQDFAGNYSPNQQDGETAELALSDISELYTLLMTQHYVEMDSSQLVEGALKGMAEATGDPHTSYLDEVDASEMSDEIEGSFEGIGTEVIKDNDVIRIISPIPDSPAEEAGLQPNDAITHVDGKSVANLSINEAVAMIRGPEGTTVDLRISRGSQEFEVTVERDSIPVESVRLDMDEKHPEIASIQITNFSVPTYEELIDKIEQAKDQGAQQFIFDVRGNPGGLLESATQIASIFVNNGDRIYGIQEDAEEAPVFFESSDEYSEFKLEAPAVLLVDEGSASASEILAGAMQEAGYPIIGSPTFGKGTVQTIYPLHELGDVKFTESIWLTAGGDWINEEGIQPDIKVEANSFQALLAINPENTYVFGQESEEVENINSTLNAMGYEVDPDSKTYTESTQLAVRDIQARNNLPTTGAISEETAYAIAEEVRELSAEHDPQYDAAVEYLLN